jgi:hypothetical protein
MLLRGILTVKISLRVEALADEGYCFLNVADAKRGVLQHVG